MRRPWRICSRRKRTLTSDKRQSTTTLRHAVVAIIEDGDDILFIERAPQDTFPGYWSTVTGSIEPGETQEQALVREAAEEVGLTVRPVAKLWESVTRQAHFLLHWWQCELIGPREVTPQEDEVADFAWLSLEQIAKMELMFSDSRWFFRNIYRRTRKPGGAR